MSRLHVSIISVRRVGLCQSICLFLCTPTEISCTRSRTRSRRSVAFTAADFVAFRAFWADPTQAAPRVVRTYAGDVAVVEETKKKA